jgi:hypothetical protein
MTQTRVDRAEDVPVEILPAAPILVLEVESAIHDHPIAAEIGGEGVGIDKRCVHGWWFVVGGSWWWFAVGSWFFH